MHTFDAILQRGWHTALAIRLCILSAASYRQTYDTRCKDTVSYRSHMSSEPTSRYAEGGIY